MKNGGGADEDLPRESVGWEERKGVRRSPDFKADIAESNCGMVHDRSMRSKDWV